jgi:hypothetical protein
LLRDWPVFDLSQWQLDQWLIGDGKMPLEPTALLSAVRVVDAGGLVGTATIVSVEGTERWWPYVVTADHVVHGQTKLSIEVPNPHRPGEMSRPIPIPEWHQPLDKVDLALARYPLESGVDFQPLRTDVFYPEGMQPMLGAIVYYVGIFAPRDLPMARSGTIGTTAVPTTITDGARTYEYDAYLVDCRSYGGFSGSPCFIQTLYATDRAPIDVAPPPMLNSEPVTMYQMLFTAPLAGLFTAHYTDDQTLANPEKTISRYGVGVMLPIEYLRKALMTDEAQKERQEMDAVWKSIKAGEQPPLRNVAASPSDESSEYERFEDLTRKLVQTPKPGRDT